MMRKMIAAAVVVAGMTMFAGTAMADWCPTYGYGRPAYRPPVYRSYGYGGGYGAYRPGYNAYRPGFNAYRPGFNAYRPGYGRAGYGRAGYGVPGYGYGGYGRGASVYGRNFSLRLGF